MRGEEEESSAPPPTWERVDEAVKHELRTHKCNMRLKTSERRLFAFVAIYSFLYDYMTSITSKDSEEWCPASAVQNLLSGVGEIIKALQIRVKYYRGTLDSLAVKRIREKHADINPAIIASRHTEMTDPDKRIWKRLYEADVAPQKVSVAYEAVKHLLPNEAISNYQPRSGPAVISSLEQQQPPPPPPPIIDFDKMNSHDFYDKYLRSDITVAKSNKLSESFSENFEILPDTNVKVPRRIERYFNVEMTNAVKNGIRFPSNYIRGMVFAYFLGELFGLAFSAMQVYLKGFGASACEACGEYVLETSSFSKIKALLISHQLLLWQGEGSKRQHFPCHLQAIETENGSSSNIRKTIAKLVKYFPDRKEKAAVAVMRSTVAEHEPDGYMAVWLSLAVSRIVGRKVSPQYALLFLVNWAAKQYQQHNDNNNQKAEEHLRRLSNSVGITFDQSKGLVLPVIGFGCGMTKTKLRNYAVHAIKHFVKELLDGGKLVEEEREDHSALTVQQLSAKLFKNNDIIKSSATGDEREILASMKGEEFVPNETRRRIHEEEYNKALTTKLKLRFHFGVCGFQHPLPTSINKHTLVTLQLLKHRQIYAERETAAAINWDRFVQFLLPRRTSLARPGSHTQFAVSRLLGLSRTFVETVSTVLRTALPCERVLDGISIKFNADILTLGKKPDSFLKTKAGLVIGKHARQALEMANHNVGRYDEARRISNLHPSEISLDSKIGRVAVDMAHGCVIARDHAVLYSEHQPFVPDTGKKFEPIPLYGIEDPIFPAKHTYLDKKANNYCDYESNFWIQENNHNIVDALVSRGILSLPALSKNKNWDILTSDNNLCIEIFKDIRKINHKDLAADKPRKSDPAPWSSKNTGQTGRSATDFSPNSVIVLSMDKDDQSSSDDDDDDDKYKEENVRGVDGGIFAVGGIKDIFFAAVETQRTMAQNDIIYPHHMLMLDKDMIRAPDISPLYRHGGKPAVITLKHTMCCKVQNKKQF